MKKQNDIPMIHIQGYIPRGFYLSYWGYEDKASIFDYFMKQFQKEKEEKK